ncbi:MAG: transketolase family protein [Firmicutes bacterium]|nr:transketolase family protein [Bacillota bacterium]
MFDDKELRAVYCESLIALAEKDERIVLLEADLMKASGTVPFKERFPERTVDVGVAEANMIGVAAGLSAFGKIPFANSFTAFATRRCFDQITISVAYAGLNVKIGGTDPGVTAELNGGTHMSLEDVGIMRTLPGMTIFEPVDGTQLKKAMPQIAAHYGPVYIRLYRRRAFKIFDDGYKFDLWKSDLLLDGKDVTLFVTGILVRSALDAAEILKVKGISAKVVNIHTIKPIDREGVISAARETGAVVTVENHNIIGGLGSAVAEVLIEECPVPMKRIGVADHFGEVGRKEYLFEKYHMTAGDIARAAEEVIAKKNRR